MRARAGVWGGVFFLLLSLFLLTRLTDLSLQEVFKIIVAQGVLFHGIQLGVLVAGKRNPHVSF